MEIPQFIKDLEGGIYALMGGGVAALVAWARTKRIQAGVSGDDLTIKANQSQVTWIASQETAIQNERQLRMAAEARERLAYGELNEALKRLREADAVNELRGERILRLQTRNRQLHQLLLETRPDISKFLVTEPAPLDK